MTFQKIGNLFMEEKKFLFCELSNYIFNAILSGPRRIERGEEMKYFFYRFKSYNLAESNFSIHEI